MKKDLQKFQKKPKQKAAKSGGQGKLSYAYTAKSRKMSGSSPKIVNLPKDTIRVTNREYLTDIPGSSDFIISYTRTLNPGNQILFPWLSSVAQRYEKYVFRKLKLMYEPVCPTTTAGTVIVAVDPDASDTAPYSKQQMLAWQLSRRAAPWDEVALDLSRVCNLPQLYVLYGGVAPENTDIKTYAAGTLYTAVQGTGAFSGVLGEIYLEYTVDLSIPNLEVPPVVSGGVTDSDSATVDNNKILGTNPKIKANVPLKWVTGNTFSLSAAGQLLIDIVGQSTIGTSLPPLTVTFEDGTVKVIASANGSISATAGNKFSAKYEIPNAWGDMLLQLPSFSGMAPSSDPSMRISTFLTSFTGAV